MNKWHRAFCLFCIHVFLSVNIYADEIHLADGMIIQGSIVEESKYIIRLAVSDPKGNDISKIPYIVKDFFISGIYHIPKERVDFIIDTSGQRKIFFSEEPFLNFEAIVGVWSPLGKRGVIGSTFITGISAGIIITQFLNVNATLLTSNPDAYPNYDYIGLDGFFRLMRRGAEEFDLLVGIGRESIYSDSKKITSIVKGFHLPGGTIGVGYRNFLDEKSKLVYVSLQARYHRLFPSGNDEHYLSKHGLSVRLSFGLNY